MKRTLGTEERLLKLGTTFCRSLLAFEPRGPAFCPAAPCAGCVLSERLLARRIDTFEEFLEVFGSPDARPMVNLPPRALKGRR